MPLAVCATPIGNLEDVTLRVLRELREADVVLCEDTRHTRGLLARHGLEGKTLVSYHEHNEASRTEETWSLSSYLTPRDVERAFGTRLGLPAPIGVGPNQPYPGGVGRVVQRPALHPGHEVEDALRVVAREEDREPRDDEPEERSEEQHQLHEGSGYQQ